MTIRDHCRKATGCRECDRNMVRNKSIVTILRNFIDASIRRHGDVFEVRNVTIEHIATNKIPLTCKEHGVFVTSPKTHLAAVYSCPKCAREHTNKARQVYATVEDLLEAAKLRHNNKYTYDAAKTDLLMSGRITVICPHHGTYTTGVGLHVQEGRNCRKCAYEEQCNTFEIFVEKANKVHGSKFVYHKESFTDNEKETKITHVLCGKTFFQVAKKHLEGQGCLCVTKPSTGERLVMDTLEKCGIEYYREYRIRGYRYRYDFYLHKMNILLEYDGPQHFIPVNHWGGKENLKNILERDKKKNNIARDAGFRLIRISYKHDSELEDYLLFKLSTYYKYRTRTVWYKDFLELCVGEEMDLFTTSVNDVKKYLVWTKNKYKK